MREAAKAHRDYTPVQRAQMSEFLKGGDIQPDMRQTAFGGEINFDNNGKQVFLEGEYSRKDLLRIVAMMKPE